jgi:hypothetical protein
MKTVTVSKRSRGINALLKEARRQNLILRSPEGHEFILAELDDFDREIELTRQNKQLTEMLAQRAKQTKTVPLKEAKTQLGLD